MIVKLHTQSKEIEDGKLKVINGEFVADLDMGLGSEIRFEAKFPELAKQNDLIGYATKLNEIKELSTGIIISKMKILYCLFDTDITFLEFLKLFDMTDAEYIDRVSKEIKDIFDLLLNGSAEKN